MLYFAFVRSVINPLFAFMYRRVLIAVRTKKKLYVQHIDTQIVGIESLIISKAIYLKVGHCEEFLTKISIF
jgi:hypothetical protein